VVFGDNNNERKKNMVDAERKLLPAHVKRVAAVRASCDPRTVQKIYEGKDVRGIAALRAKKALILLGHLVDPDFDMNSVNLPEDIERTRA
jgi:hypothetical protein